MKYQRQPAMRHTDPATPWNALDPPLLTSKSLQKRRPRDGYISQLIYKIKRLIRDLYRYARRHPARVAMLLLPLITGGALAGILKQFGIR